MSATRCMLYLCRCESFVVPAALLLAGCLANPQRHLQARCDSCNPPACFYITQATRQHQRCCSIAQPALVDGVLRLLNQGKLITGHGNNSSSHCSSSACGLCRDSGHVLPGHECTMRT